MQKTRHLASKSCLSYLTLSLVPSRCLCVTSRRPNLLSPNQERRPKQGLQPASKPASCGRSSATNSSRGSHLHGCGPQPRDEVGDGGDEGRVQPRQRPRRLARPLRDGRPHLPHTQSPQMLEGRSTRVMLEPLSASTPLKGEGYVIATLKSHQPSCSKQHSFAGTPHTTPT